MRALIAVLLLAVTAGAADFDLDAYIKTLNETNVALADLGPAIEELNRQLELADYWADWYEFQAEADAAAERIFTGKPETVFIPVTDELEIL